MFDFLWVPSSDFLLPVKFVCWEGNQNGCFLLRRRGVCSAVGQLAHLIGESSWVFIL